MNNHLTCSFILLCSFLATSCSTQTKNQTNEVSTTAVIYTNTINKLLAATKDRVIEMDSKQLSMSQSGKNKAQKLKQKNEALDQWLHVAGQLHKQNVLLQEYFMALQAMVDEPTKNDMSDTLGSVSYTLSKINHAAAKQQDKEPRNRVLNYLQTGYISGLSNTLISAHYTGKVKQALMRDKDIIDRQISLQAKQLDLIASIYKRRTVMDNHEHYANRVLGPFVSQSPNNQFEVYSWTQSRLKWFNRKEALNIFEDVQAANKGFREAWQNILQGKRDIGAIKAMLSDVNRFVTNAQSLDDSIKHPQVIYATPYQPTPQ